MNNTEVEVEAEVTVEENRDPTIDEGVDHDAGNSYFTAEYDEVKMKDTQALYETMCNLNKSHFDAVMADTTEEQSEEMYRYTNALSSLVGRVGNIKVPEEYSGKTDETEDIKKIT